MAYDEHAPNTAAGPVSGFPWFARVASYARAAAPLGRVELALPAFGYDWSAATATASATPTATPVSARQASALAAAHGIIPSWDPVEREDTFSYTADGRTHTVWYENAAADLDRARLAVADGFAGIDLWAAGQEDPALWSALRTLDMSS